MGEVADGFVRQMMAFVKYIKAIVGRG